MENGDLAKRVIRLAPWLAVGSLLTLISGVLIGSLIAGSDANDIFARIGQVGDVTGGVTAPILNFLGMLIVYYSLREQLRANNMQNEAIKSELKNASGEALLKSTEGMIGAAAELVNDGKVEIQDVNDKVRGFERKVHITNGLNRDQTIQMHHDDLLLADEHLRPLAVLVSTIYDRISNENFPEEYRLYILHLFNAKCMRHLPRYHITLGTTLNLDYAPNYRWLFNLNVAFHELYNSLYQVSLNTPIKVVI